VRLCVPFSFLLQQWDQRLDDLRKSQSQADLGWPVDKNLLATMKETNQKTIEELLSKMLRRIWAKWKCVRPI
jgi:hypothetical protein